MAIQSLRILVKIMFPNGQVARLWGGSGPVIGHDGEVWRGSSLGDNLDTIESAMNGEIATLNLSLLGVAEAAADTAFEDLQAGNVVGAVVQVMLQECDKHDQPVGTPKVKFTGTVNNLPMEDITSGSTTLTNITAECVNRFALRGKTSGDVLSDVTQKARAARLNPLAPPDRMCERIPTLLDRTVAWPQADGG